MAKIDEWTKKQKMEISEKKTKAMIFNFTNKFQFSTRLQLKGNHIEIVDKMKILGTIVNNQLTWDDNCNNLIRKVNSRMQLIRGIQSFGATQEELVHLWKIFAEVSLNNLVLFGDHPSPKKTQKISREHRKLLQN